MTIEMIMNPTIKRQWLSNLQVVGKRALRHCRRTKVVKVADEWSFIWWRV
jgi:hypothetical protein